ncbi:hypothetical protein [Mycobacterium sp. 852002-51163_SCH5372311]|uniref:hypothetical protein n=1 Tax=Mycobacterium sp. 852002-51163_SCH5372311 TaxID=1834097 RepID=UPI0012E929A2|nr:hypothetical protein [Mycobacterium sp. 852002-51163_SCH5372311]
MTVSADQLIKSAVGVAVVVAASAVLGATSARADDTYQQFASPSGSIRCILNGQDARLPIALCQIGDHTYAVEAGVARDQNGGACPWSSRKYVTCTYSAIGSGFGSWPPLAYGQTRSLGAITCDSEPAGMTCTDSSTGHFFRVSRESYQLG